MSTLDSVALKALDVRWSGVPYKKYLRNPNKHEKRNYLRISGGKEAKHFAELEKLVRLPRFVFVEPSEITECLLFPHILLPSAAEVLSVGWKSPTF